MTVRVSHDRLSIVIPTRNRAALLEASLASLARQTLSRDEFEVIVVDDGSTDETREVSERFRGALRLQYHRLQHAGIAAAKNLGTFAASGSVVLYFDDDDVAGPDLCAEHLAMHDRHPDPRVAVLGYTGWAPKLRVTPVMHYVTNVGHYLFSYSDLEHGQSLDFTYFWGGRASCKRLLLVRHGVFDQGFRFGCEDIELAYRLSRERFSVVFTRQAEQFMNRPVTFDEFCRRCEAQGRSQWAFARLHPDPVVQQYCEVEDAERRWAAVATQLDARVARVHEIERALARRRQAPRRGRAVEELHELYRWVFDASKLKGIADVAGFGDGAVARSTAPVAPLETRVS